MKIPRYIVIKLEMVDKNTIKATEITDRCEVYEYEVDETAPQTERHLPDYSYEADLGRRIMEQTGIRKDGMWTEVIKEEPQMERRK